MANGIIVIDKPADWTSNDVVVKLKRLLWEKRIGHAGTLDPMATGVLPVFVGRATRAVEFAAEGGKEYLAGLTLGKTTDTQDSTGTVLTETPCQVTKEELEGVLDRFRGDILQVPPMYSALKVNGKRLYDLARKGKEVERKPRPITIHELEVLEQQEENTWLLRVRCSKGTYIRTLCHDIGEALGVGGIMCSLRRTEAAGFTLEQAVTLEQVEKAWEAGTAQELLLPVADYFKDYPSTVIAGKQEERCRNGNEFPCSVEDGTWRVYNESGEFMMLGKCENGIMKTVKSFFEV
jgi:tRNA pseudouridine55 synthase